MTILLTGGRAAATLELARMLHASGHRVVMAEHIGWHLSRFSRAISRHYTVRWPTRDLDGFADDLARIIEREGVELLIPTCEEVFHVARRRGRFACAVYCDTLEALAQVHHKGRFVEAAERLGLAVPESVLCSDSESLQAAVARLGEVVLKPAWSRFGARTLVRPTTPLPVPTPTDPWVVQRFLPGRQLCTWGLCHQGRLVAFCAYETRFTLGIGASASFEMLDGAQARPLAAWMARFVEGLGFTGQLGLDFIEDAAGVAHGIEANPRITSGFHLFARKASDDRSERRRAVGRSPERAADTAGSPGVLERYWNPELPRLEPPAGEAAMLGVSMLLARRKLKDPERLRAWKAVWRRSREVVWSLRDPVPVLWRFVWLAGVVLRGKRAGRPPAEAIAVDMEWNGEP